jgi:hypothetical protein
VSAVRWNLKKSIGKFLSNEKEADSMQEKVEKFA